MRDNLEYWIQAGIGGRYWYENSRNSCAEWVQSVNSRLGCSISVDHALTVAAILSPRVQVQRSISLACNWIVNRDATGIMGQRVNALIKYETTGVVGGVKIKDFLDSLRLVPGTVCCDIHMSRLFGFDKGEIMQTSKHWTRQREKVQNIVRRLADRWGMESYQCQACLWVGWLSCEVYKKDHTWGAMKWGP